VLTIKNKSAKYRVAIIGGGRMGTHHARAYDLHPLCEVVAVADTDQENLDIFTRRFECAGYSTYDEMFRKEKLDIVGPVLPVKANADAVVASARAGVKAVFCDKPMTARLSDADRMVAECEKNGVIFGAGVIPRNYPEYQKAKDLVNAGEIGNVQSINIYDPNGQGGCHNLNLALMFNNDIDPEWCTGWVGGDPMSDGDGDGDLKGIGGFVKFKNGVELFSHRRESVKSKAGEQGQGIEVIGTKGVIWSDSKGLHIAKAQADYKPGTLADLKYQPGVFEDHRNLKGRSYDEEGWANCTPGMLASVAALVEAVDTGKPVRMSTGQSLRKALEICIGMRESHRRGHAPVKFPLEDRSLVMFPVTARWEFKKYVYGREEYMKDIMSRKIDAPAK